MSRVTPGPGRESGIRFDRREILVGTGVLLGLGVTGLSCSDGAGPPALRPGQVAVPLPDLPVGGRRIVMVGENPVEVTRSGSDVSAVMLRCTHMGCVVRWKPEERIYACPCHDGRYDAEGQVISGPPPAPLRRVPVSVRGGRAILG